MDLGGYAGFEITRHEPGIALFTFNQGRRDRVPREAEAELQRRSRRAERRALIVALESLLPPFRLNSLPSTRP